MRRVAGRIPIRIGPIVSRPVIDELPTISISQMADQGEDVDSALVLTELIKEALNGGFVFVVVLVREPVPPN
jgi:hypothetical protein